MKRVKSSAIFIIICMLAPFFSCNHTYADTDSLESFIQYNEDFIHSHLEGTPIQLENTFKVIDLDTTIKSTQNKVITSSLAAGHVLMMEHNNNGGYTLFTVSPKPVAMILDNEFNLINNIQFPMEEGWQCEAIKEDESGNYYVFSSAKAMPDDHNMATQSVMRLVKYNASGSQIKAMEFNGDPNGDANDCAVRSGVKGVAYGSNVAMCINGDLIAVYFGRLMFNGHQASYGFILNKNTFERLTSKSGPMYIPYASHSFEQDIIPIENGFLFVDKCDGFPKRGYQITSVMNHGMNGQITPFLFKGGYGENEVFSRYGGIVQTNYGYLLAGRYQNSTEALTTTANNIFVQAIGKTLQNAADPIYFTNYSDLYENDCSAPQIVDIGSGRYLLAWNEYGKNNLEAPTDSTSPKGIRMLLIDQMGTPLSDEIFVSNTWSAGIALNSMDTIVFDEKAGKVYWAATPTTGTVMASQIGIFSIDINQIPVSKAPSGNQTHSGNQDNIAGKEQNTRFLQDNRTEITIDDFKQMVSENEEYYLFIYASTMNTKRVGAEWITATGKLGLAGVRETIYALDLSSGEDVAAFSRIFSVNNLPAYYHGAFIKFKGNNLLGSARLTIGNDEDEKNLINLFK